LGCYVFQSIRLFLFFVWFFEIIWLFSGEEIWGYFLFFFFDFLMKKLINSTKSGCEGQLSEINILCPKNPSIFH
jgi:hypothetical protein